MKFTVYSIQMIANETEETTYVVEFEAMRPHFTTLKIYSSDSKCAKIDQARAYTLTEIDNLFNH